MASTDVQVPAKPKDTLFLPLSLVETRNVALQTAPKSVYFISPGSVRYAAFAASIIVLALSKKLVAADPGSSLQHTKLHDIIRTDPTYAFLLKDPQVLSALLRDETPKPKKKKLTDAEQAAMKVRMDKLHAARKVKIAERKEEKRKEAEEKKDVKKQKVAA